MTTKKLILLQALLLLGFSSVFLMAHAPNSQPVGISLSLPDSLGEWDGAVAAVSEMERAGLGLDTEFARKSYRNGRGDEIYVSIVLSGQDMNNSIHRPERCLPAQGWTVADSSTVAIPLDPAGREKLLATRLHNYRQFAPSPDAPPRNIYNLNYYWFVGYHHVTPSHFERAFLDIKDRLLSGTSQRWAYVTVAATITDNLTKFGRSEKETDEMLQAFIARITPVLMPENPLDAEPSGPLSRNRG